MFSRLLAMFPQVSNRCFERSVPLIHISFKADLTRAIPTVGDFEIVHNVCRTDDTDLEWTTWTNRYSLSNLSIQNEPSNVVEVF